MRPSARRGQLALALAFLAGPGFTGTAIINVALPRSDMHQADRPVCWLAGATPIDDKIAGTKRAEREETPMR